MGVSNEKLLERLTCECELLSEHTANSLPDYVLLGPNSPIKSVQAVILLFTLEGILEREGALISTEEMIELMVSLSSTGEDLTLGVFLSAVSKKLTQ